jgi:hypothetical protein
MHSDKMSSSVQQFFADANDLQWKKNADYHPDKVAFLEILRTAFECGISVEQDLWAKLRKQYIALRSFAIDGKVESEPPRSRMIDIAVYMGMFAFWVENRRDILRGAEEFMVGHTHCEHTDGTFTCIGQRRDVPCERCQFVVWLQNQ